MEQKALKRKSKNGHFVPGLVKAWSGVGSYVSTIRNKQELEARIAFVDSLVDEIGDDESHPLAELLHLASRLVEEYEKKQVKIPNAAPREVLKFLMEDRGIKQKDLKSIIPQSNLSAVLHGKRELTLEQVAKLSSFFCVSADLLMPKFKLRGKSSRVH